MPPRQTPNTSKTGETGKTAGTVVIPVPKYNAAERKELKTLKEAAAGFWEKDKEKRREFAGDEDQLSSYRDAVVRLWMKFPEIIHTWPVIEVGYLKPNCRTLWQLTSNERTGGRLVVANTATTVDSPLGFQDLPGDFLAKYTTGEFSHDTQPASKSARSRDTVAEVVLGDKTGETGSTAETEPEENTTGQRRSARIRQAKKAQGQSDVEASSDAPRTSRSRSRGRKRRQVSSEEGEEHDDGEQGSPESEDDEGNAPADDGVIWGLDKNPNFIEPGITTPKGRLELPESENRNEVKPRCKQCMDNHRDCFLFRTYNEQRARWNGWRKACWNCANIGEACSLVPADGRQGRSIGKGKRSLASIQRELNAAKVKVKQLEVELELLAEEDDE